MRRKTKLIRRLEKLLATGIEVQVGTVSVLGPMSLAHLALIVRYGGYKAGDDLLDDLVAPGDVCRVRLLVIPPPE